MKGRAALLCLCLMGCGDDEAARAPAPCATAASAGPRRDDAADVAHITEMLAAWHEAAARADEATYFGYFADEAVFMGTDATERWDVAAFRAYAHPHFARGKAWSFRASRRKVALGPDGVAWFDEDLVTANLGPARGTGVVVKGGDGRWRIAHYNLAITVPNERFDAVKALLEVAPAASGAPAGSGAAGASASASAPPPGSSAPPPPKPPRTPPKTPPGLSPF